MQNLSKLALYSLAWCIFLSLFGKNYRHEKDTPGRGQLWYVDLLLLINQNFVKWIWGWTMLVITPFAVLFAYKIQHFKRRKFSNKKLKSSMQYHKLIHPLTRINLLGTIIWYLFTKLKSFLYNNTGRCLIENSNKAVLQASNAKSCRWLTNEEKLGQQGYWTGFNLSGHSFMLNFSFMIVATELYGFYQLLKINYDSKSSKYSQQKTSKLLAFLKIYYHVCLFFLFLCLLCVSVTYLVYHTFIEKVIGTVLALFCWQIIYFDYCKRGKEVVPFLIGEVMVLKED